MSLNTDNRWNSKISGATHPTAPPSPTEETPSPVSETIVHAVAVETIPHSHPTSSRVISNATVISNEAQQGEEIDEEKGAKGLSKNVEKLGFWASLVNKPLKMIQETNEYYSSRQYATEQIKQNPRNYSKLLPKWQYDPSIIQEVLMMDPTIYHSLSEHLRSNEEVQLFKNTGEVIALHEGRISLDDCGQEIQNNYAAAYVAVERSPYALLLVGQSIRDNPTQYQELMMLAARTNPVQLLTQVRKKEVLENRAVLLECCRNPEAFQCLPDKFKKDKAFCLEVVTNINGKVWSKLSSTFKDDVTFAKAAMKQTTENPFGFNRISFLPKTLQKDREICFRMIKINKGTDFWRDVPEQFRLDTAFVEQAEKDTPKLQLWDRLTQERKKAQEEALKQLSNMTKERSNMVIFIPIEERSSWVHQVLSTLMENDVEFCKMCLTTNDSSSSYVPINLRSHPELNHWASHYR